MLPPNIGRFRSRLLVASIAVFAGAWLSGFFIVATDAWMQNPVGYKLGPHGEIELDSLAGLIFNPWVLWQYLHTMGGAHERHNRRYLYQRTK